jgi:hypothetical protein
VPGHPTMQIDVPDDGGVGGAEGHDDDGGGHDHG